LPELYLVSYQQMYDNPIYGERYCISVPPCPDSRWGNGVSPTKLLGKRRSPSTTPLHIAFYSVLSLLHGCKKITIQSE